MYLSQDSFPPALAALGFAFVVWAIYAAAQEEPQQEEPAGQQP
jgi:hypothetical protein